MLQSQPCWPCSWVQSALGGGLPTCPSEQQVTESHRGQGWLRHPGAKLEQQPICSTSTFREAGFAPVVGAPHCACVSRGQQCPKDRPWGAVGQTDTSEGWSLPSISLLLRRYHLWQG